jgi:energy-coupling factor transporter transmembrane protein EcfT
MKQPRTRYARFVPSIADILFLTIFLYLFFSGGKMLLGDGDTGYHIRAGEYILKTFSVPVYDIFSYLTPAIPWTAHEWLSEVLMALIQRVSGLSGVVFFFAGIIAAVYYLLFKIIRSYKGNILVAISIVLLVILSSQVHWLARPHVFSRLRIVIWYHLLDLNEYSGRNYLYLFAASYASLGQPARGIYYRNSP